MLIREKDTEMGDLDSRFEYDFNDNPRDGYCVDRSYVVCGIVKAIDTMKYDEAIADLTVKLSDNYIVSSF